MIWWLIISPSKRKTNNFYLDIPLSKNNNLDSDNFLVFKTFQDNLHIGKIIFLTYVQIMYLKNLKIKKIILIKIIFHTVPEYRE